MAALGNSAEILLKIKADADQAVNEIGQVKTSVAGLGGGLASVAGGFNVATLATTGFTAILTAQVTAAAAATVGLFRLAKAASDAGSELYDAQGKTGLTAATLSTLKLAADNAGSSFDGITGSVAKLNVLVGQANQGNEKAIETLNQYGIQSRDLQGVLEESIRLIANETDETKQAAITKDLFKDKTGALLPVIKQMGGELKNATQDAERLGTTLSEKNIQAADEFGDALGLLSSQVSTAAQRFALEFAPAITSAMTTISGVLANNQEVARIWGQTVADVMWTATTAFNSGKNAISGILDALGIKFASSASQARFWAEAILFSLNPILGIAARLGALFNKNVSAQMGGQFGGGGAAIALPAIPTGGGSRGGGGGGDSGGLVESEFDKVKKANQQSIAEVKQAVSESMTENDRLLAEGIRDEQTFLETKKVLNLFEIEEEIKLTKKLLEIQSINAEQKAEVEHNLNLLRSKLRAAENKEATDQAKRDSAAIEKAAKDKIEWEEWIEKQIKAIRERQRKAANDNARTEVDPDGSLGDRKKFVNDINLSYLGDSVLSIRDEFGDLEDMMNPMVSAFQMGGQALNQFAQGVGNVVQNLVLMGTAGPNAMKKLVASVLAGVSAQAATLAIMELAYGIAALTPWGAAIYGPAPPHFKAAALFGSVALGSGVIGRGVAGDSFASGGGSAGGSGGGSDGAGNRPGLVFTERFAGFEKQISEGIDKAMQPVRVVMGGVAEAVNRFNDTFGVTTPDAVVMAGAGGATSAIFGAVETEMISDGTKATTLKRAMGDY